MDNVLYVTVNSQFSTILTDVKEPVSLAYIRNIANLWFVVRCQLTTVSLLAHLKASGQLVLLGYDIAAFTPVAYLGRSLQPPLMDILS